MQKSKHRDSDLLTTTPVAIELRVSPQAVIQWEKRGILPAIKTANGQRLFRRADVERLKRIREERKQP